MTVSFDIFSLASFPVIVCDETGIVIYKNQMSKLSLRSVRRGISMQRRLVSGTIAGSETQIVDTGWTSTFRKAIVSSLAIGAEHYRVLLFLPFLQFDQFSGVCNDIMSAYSDDILRFFSDSSNLLRGYPCGRICGDMVDFVKKQSNYFNDIQVFCDVYQTMEILFSKLSGAFRALGVRISADIDSEVIKNRVCDVGARTFVFVLCRMIYCAIRASSTKLVKVSATSDPCTRQVVVSVMTDSPVLPRHDADIASVAPECALEARLVGEVVKMRDSVKIYSLGGKLTLDYRVDCVQGAFNSLRLCSYSSVFDLYHIIDRNMELLKDMIKSHK